MWKGCTAIAKTIKKQWGNIILDVVALLSKSGYVERFQDNMCADFSIDFAFE